MNILQTMEYNLRKKSPRTKDRYMGITQEYIRFSGGLLDRTTMLKFMESTENKWSDSSRRLTHYVLKKLCKAMEKPFPLDADDLYPTTAISKLYTPTLSVPTIQSMISWFKPEGSYTTALLFLSTMYGCRSLELTRIIVGNNIVTIPLAKKRGGVPLDKTHILPPGMFRHLTEYKNNLSEWLVIQQFHIATSQVTINPVDGAWHTIRRSLITQLQLAGVDPEVITRYMGWEKSATPPGASPMVGRYFHIPDSDIDDMVYRKHPFIEMWR